MKSTCLRIELNEGRQAEEYRIVGANVEGRRIHLEHQSVENAWWPLTSAELSNHVQRNTVGARWLEQCWGWRRLLRACVGSEAWSGTREHDTGNSDYRDSSST